MPIKRSMPKGVKLAGRPKKHSLSRMSRGLSVGRTYQMDPNPSPPSVPGLPTKELPLPNPRR